MLNNYEIRGNNAIIFLNNYGLKFETVISLSDLERANEFPFKWKAVKKINTNDYYVYGGLSKKQAKLYEGKQTIQLHRWLLKPSAELHIDHINHDTLNNTRENLREATPIENAQNRLGPMSNNSTSGVLGVTWHKRDRFWQAKVVINKKQVYLGSYKNLKDAEAAVKKARKELMPYSQEALAN